MCEFCSLPLSPGHRHVLEVATRKIVCACNACALRFDNVVGRWKLIPRDSRRLVGFQMTDAQWEGFAVPIGLAFFYSSTPGGRVVATSPSPAGATESLAPLSSWPALIDQNPVLMEMQSDVEALLVNRLKEPCEYYLAAIDRCFELVGVIRLYWRGFSGGDQVWAEMDRFFGRLQTSAPIGQREIEVTHA